MFRDPFLLVSADTGCSDFTNGSADRRLVHARGTCSSLLGLGEECDIGEVDEAADESCREEVGGKAVMKRKCHEKACTCRDEVNVHLIVEDRDLRLNDSYDLVEGCEVVQFVLSNAIDIRYNKKEKKKKLYLGGNVINPDVQSNVSRLDDSRSGGGLNIQKKKTMHTLNLQQA